MSERGVFAVDRGIWNDPDFPNEPFSEREAFLWLVSEAAWRPTKVRVGSKLIELERGQCSFSTRFMAAKFQWSEARVRRFLQRRSDMNQLCTKTDAGATQITICKYDAFQRVGIVGDAQSTQERRSSDAKKKQGNIETSPTEPEGSSGEVARKRATRIPENFEPDIGFAMEQGLSLAETRAEVAKFSDWARSAPGQKGVKADWPATWRNWVRRAGADRKGRAPPGKKSLLDTLNDMNPDSPEASHENVYELAQSEYRRGDPRQGSYPGDERPDQARAWGSAGRLPSGR